MNRVVEEFDRAADTYEESSSVQRDIAARLVEFIGNSKPENILEIGCGTGNLTRKLAAKFPNANIVATDASPRMLNQAKEYVQDGNVSLAHFHLDDKSILDQDWNLVISNMTFQWLENPIAVAHHLLKRCQQLVFSLPVAGTFQNWIDAHQNLGLKSGVREFVHFDELENSIRSISPDSRIECLPFAENYSNAIQFIRHLKNIGGSTPRPGHSCVNLRPVIAQFLRGIKVTYQIALVDAKADES